MQRLLFLLIPFAFLFTLDIYSFQAFKTVSSNKGIYAGYWFVALLVYILFFSAALGFLDIPKPFSNYIFGTLLAIYIFKFVLIWFLMIEDVVRLGKWVATWFQNTPSSSETAVVAKGNGISRSKFLSTLGITVASIPFIAVFHGMIRNAYNYQVKKVSLPIANLPSVFEGLKIVQISDLHTGSFSTTKPLYRAVELITQQNPDLVFFTGDLVNFKAEEAVPYIDIFKNISANIGVFSVLGNHDYGDYTRWPTPQDKVDNANLMREVHQKMGWNLLLNDHHIVEKEGAKLAIIGVENWTNRHNHGGRRQYGDLQKACEGCEADVKFLLSHDPSHWRGQVVTDTYKDINATFSGHTHGLQFGINFAGLKLSPVQLAYKEWWGLYKEGKQHLYVNPGFGFVGFPGRVGILPEITVFELTTA